MTAPVRLRVAAGILIDNGGRVLLTERVGDSPFAGLWEFPGGKLHDNETAEQALHRELREELAITVLEARFFKSLQHEYPDRAVALDFFLITDWQGELQSCDGQALRWEAPQDIDPEELLPADAPILAALRQELATDAT